MYSRHMLLSQMIGDSGNAITFSATLWLRYENITKTLGRTFVSYIYTDKVVLAHLK